MPLLIDGHNLIGHSPDLSLSDPNDEAKLIARLKAYIARTGKEITVVFDPGTNRDPAGYGRFREGRLEVIYAQGRTADDVIREIVGEVKDKQGLIVVTSDRRLENFTRQCGVRVRSSAEFEHTMQQVLKAESDNDSEKPIADASETNEFSERFKEPEPQPRRQPTAAPRLSPQEQKRQRRMAQLQKQVRGGGKLIR